MRLSEYGFRDLFERYYLMRCTWTELGLSPDKWPWPAEADAVLVYVRDNLFSSGLSLSVLCPVMLAERRYLSDWTPEKVHRDNVGYLTDIGCLACDPEAIPANQEEAASLELLSFTDTLMSDSRRRVLESTELDPWRTPLCYDSFPVRIQTGDGDVMRTVRMENREGAVFTGRIIDMFDDGIELYENDLIEVRLVEDERVASPTLIGKKIEKDRAAEPPSLRLQERAALELWTSGLEGLSQIPKRKAVTETKPERATKDSWKIREMPSRYEEFQLGLEITAEEKELLEYGHIPCEMEDRWFAYCDDGWVHYHRGWTGYCIFEAKIEPLGDHFVITEARVNRYPGHYSGTSLEWDRYLLASLILTGIGKII